MNSKYILDALKVILKKKKINYKQVAAHLQISEAGVKKMFASADISLNRILKICEIVEVPLVNLIEASENRAVKKLKLNRLQMDFFGKNPDYFFFFLQLANAQSKVSEVIQKNNLSEKSAWKYLKKLDDLRLIKLKSGNKVEHIYRLPLSVDADSEFLKNLRAKMAIRFIQNIQKIDANSTSLSIGLFKLSLDNIESLKKEVQAILTNYQRRSEIDKTIFSEEELSDFSFLTASSLESFIPSVPNL